VLRGAGEKLEDMFVLDEDACDRRRLACGFCSECIPGGLSTILKGNLVVGKRRNRGEVFYG